MATEQQVKKALSTAIKTAVEHSVSQSRFDKIAGEYFDVEDFGGIYNHHDALVDPIVYGDGTLTFNQLKKEVDEYKKELKQKE